jgi:hypothetical protein
MNNLKTFESFSRDAFNLPLFNEMTDEEDEKVSDALYKGLGEFQNNFFQMDEPSTGFRANEDIEVETRADYWLVNPTVNDLEILSDAEFKNLESLYPKKKITRVTVNGKDHSYYFNVVYGTFIWYSIKGPKRQYRIWLIAKDEDHLFRAIDAEYITYGKQNTILRSAWDSAKQWEDLDVLLAEQIPHLKSIGKYVQEHCENEEDEKSSMRNEIDHDDPNDGLEPWR